MKKTYLQPSAEMVIAETSTFICGSQDITGSDGYGITYGGVDNEGGLDPASRRRRDVWEDVGDEEDF